MAPSGAVLRFGDEVILTAPAEDYREAVHTRLRAVATRELTGRTRELAGEHGIELRRITVRAQKTRWGSCSSRGILSLNGKLIHAPPMVQDYLIVHELMHRHEMNHSSRFWKRVATAFPAYREAERWLKQARLDAFD
jgi:predicted metal-dependent hydrolase